MALIAAIDRINVKMGCGTIAPAAAGVTRPWQMRGEQLSSQYTTRWAELPAAGA